MADSNSTSFGSVFASGIQDVAAVAAVLGTDICDINAGLALTRGYLFPAACGMSMFGILGLARHILKSFLPQSTAKNLSIEVEKLDIYRVDKAIQGITKELSPDKKYHLLVQDARIRMRVPGYDRSTWIGAFASCFILSCANFIPYLPHYKALLLYPEYSSDSSGPYIYYPLLLTFSSFVASFICWFDAVIMLSGSPSLYNIDPSDMKLFESYHFGSLFARRIGYVIGLLAAVGIIIGYIGSYLVVQTMTPKDTYYWLGFQLTLCFLRLTIWSSNTKKDDLNVIKIRYKIDKTDERLIEQIESFPHKRINAKEAIDKLKSGDYFIWSEVTDTYYQAKYYTHDYRFRNFNDFRTQNDSTSCDIDSRPIYYILWNKDLFIPQKILVVHLDKGSLTEIHTGKVSYVKILGWPYWTYHLEKSKLKSLKEEQVGVEVLRTLKSKMDDIAPWKEFVAKKGEIDSEKEKIGSELQEDERMYKNIKLEPRQD
ncbi:hypothetical protein CU097_014765 [Rhizopus azygosporus]|uniref:Uncharacterized protein n=1 Tax=Rhizopus azygosporus TaxID=86630 RepID=A0A367K6K2_RHIAZ|nr:hypothetical protein CU097_014765 [Rhizopus azygosporus]